MKVVIAHNRYASAQPSGENAIVDAEIEQLAAAGVTVVPFLRDSDDIPSLPPAQKALLPIAPIWSPFAQREFAALLLAARPQVVHLHNPYPLISPWIVRTAHQHGVPVVQTVHNYRHVCPAGLYFRAGQICQDCRGRMLATPAVIHGCYRGSRAQSAIMASALAVHRSTWRSVNRFIALTSYMAAFLADFGIAPERIVVKPNGIADPGVAAGSGHGFLFLGRLSAEKGIDLLVEAWSRHAVDSLGPLRIAGDGPLRSKVAAFAAGRRDVTFLGPLDTADKYQALAESAALIVPSVWHEPLPTVILEALASGRPVVGTDLGGIPYLIGDAGWVVPPSAAELAAVLPVAAVEAAALRSRARDRYLTTFTPALNVERLLAIYSDLAAS